MQIVAEAGVGLFLDSLSNEPGDCSVPAYPSRHLLTFLGGSMADRYDKRTLLVVKFQCLALVFSLILYFLSLSESIAFWQIGCLAVCLGISNAIDIPVRQSFVVDMVGKEHLNAIALNFNVFNAARIVGPAIAGLLVSRVSLPICFLINALPTGPSLRATCMRPASQAERLECEQHKAAVAPSCAMDWGTP